jgi:DNA polymerase-1
MIFLDTEVTTWSKGSPFDERNFLVCCGWVDDTGRKGIWYAGEPQADFEEELGKHECWVFFNAKFDLHWLRKCGFSFPKRVFCTQVAEFVLNGQAPKYPSLDGVAGSYGIPGKFDLVKTEYWDKGINTDQVPRPILTEYCIQDIEVTRSIYGRQLHRPEFPRLKVLLSLEMQDLLVLEDIEWNGMYFNPEKVKAKEKQLDEEISKLQTSLDVYHNVPSFNWASPTHLSALLYGGTIEEVKKIPIGAFKTGKRVGDTRYKNEIVEHKLPRMYNPPRGSELAKPGVWSVNEDTLMSIKGGKKELIQKILKVKELAKLQSTYVAGLLKTHEEQHQEPNYIHGQYNQVVAGTGRLSSSNPNMQNMSEAVLDIFESRFQ